MGVRWELHRLVIHAAGANKLSFFLYTLDDHGNRTNAAEALVLPI